MVVEVVVVVVEVVVVLVVVVLVVVVLVVEVVVVVVVVVGGWLSTGNHSRNIHTVNHQTHRHKHLRLTDNPQQANCSLQYENPQHILVPSLCEAESSSWYTKHLNRHTINVRISSIRTSTLIATMVVTSQRSVSSERNITCLLQRKRNIYSIFRINI